MSHYEIDTVLPSQPETKSALLASPSETTAWPFEGAWPCLSDSFGSGPISLRFGPDTVTVPAICSTVGYADVAKIGGCETAYLGNLMDGQQTVLVELEADRVILFAAGNLFDCIWEIQP